MVAGVCRDRRASNAGTVRDHGLGRPCSTDARGFDLRVRSPYVAGYDVSRLIGVLWYFVGPVCEVSLQKCLPIYRATATLCLPGL